MQTFLIGGGWRPDVIPALYGPFLRAAGPDPTIACLVLDEGDGEAQAERWTSALLAAGRCRPFPVLLEDGAPLDVSAFGDADGLLVCGGLTPSYARALGPQAAAVREWLADTGRPYAGFSAGAAVAAQSAVVGGWLSSGVTVCPEDSAEDLEEITVVPGLGLVPFAVDVHAAQWGTLNRLIEAVSSGQVDQGIAVDENTLVTVRQDDVVVTGAGRAHRVRRAPDGVVVVSAGDGAVLDV